MGCERIEQTEDELRRVVEEGGSIKGVRTVLERPREPEVNDDELP
jgi:hypothetical protein